ncbi:MAG: DUF2256 domain-containing protein [Candidatus Sericytochromatia bacterium]|nr:DUF2256 domain-containing protein [Candidatus Sericytochromatia bacterium]
MVIETLRRASVRGVDRRDLPEKVCPVCGRPFSWRKKWERVWDEVRYCSERCRRRRQGGAPPPP